MASLDIVQYRSPLRRLIDVLVYVFLAAFFVWTLLPFVIMLVSSFKDLLEAFNLPRKGDWSSALSVFFDFTPTVRHYVELFTDKNFSVFFLNSVVASVGSALLSVILGTMAAYSLSRIDFVGKKHVFFWVISTRMAPVVAVMVPLYAIFRGLNLIGTLPGLILAYTTFNLPFAIWILKGFFDNVPYAIEEAAMVDGRTRFGALREIMPLVAPGIGACLVLSVLFSWNDFLFASIIGSGGAKTLPVATRELVTPTSIQWGKIMAAGIVTSVPMMFLGLVIRRYLVAGLTMGAVKE